MIKFEFTKVTNFEGAFRGMRNPMNSWNRSDSVFVLDNGDDLPVAGMLPEVYQDCLDNSSPFVAGVNDLALAQKLCLAGSDHGKLARQIFVCVDITAPLYWWKEFDTYKVGTVANSTSTMHKLGSRPLTIGDFSYDEEDGTVDCTDEYTQETIDSINRKISLWKNYTESAKKASTQEVKDHVNKMAKRVWRKLVQDLPSSFNQTRTVTMNYENLRNMYFSRKNHKLIEWRELCKWITGLPQSELITEPRMTAKERHQAGLIKSLDADIRDSLTIISEINPVLFIAEQEKLAEAILEVQARLSHSLGLLQSPDPTAN